MSEDFKTLQPWMRPFPPPEEVFAGGIAKHTEHFQPLLSIEAAQIDPAWQGWLHFILPKYELDNFDGALLQFKRDANSCLTIFDFDFTIADQEKQPSLYDEAEIAFARTKAFFLRHSILQSDTTSHSGLNWLESIGGQPPLGNWQDALPNIEYVKDVKQKRGYEQSYVKSAYPLTEDKRRYHFIAWLYGFHYRDRAVDRVLLFYDPTYDIQMIVLDWS